MSYFPNFNKQYEFTKNNKLEGHIRLKNYDFVVKKENM